MNNMVEKKKNKEMICEFFGIKIRTYNSNLAELLKTDIKDVVGVKIRPKKSEEIVCEFFGIKIVTKNPYLAEKLTTDIRSLNLKITLHK